MVFKITTLLPASSFPVTLLEPVTQLPIKLFTRANSLIGNQTICAFKMWGILNVACY